ncbi:MAG: aspartate aminotransferase family protein, partial [Caldilineae bacterium]
GALARFLARYEPWMSGGAGPRYFGFVTGGVTPAALVGDWLTSVYDQNALGSGESIAPQLELDALALLRQLFGLSSHQAGVFVTGATTANFVGLAVARQWVAQQQGIDVAQDGLWALEPFPIFSGAPHSSVYKALSMLGLGRSSLEEVPCLPQREAVDLAALERRLQEREDRACVVVANAGTVNTVDFDDLAAIAEMKQRYPFWLHVDAAFGGFAACSPRHRHLVQGIDLADSITIDAHKWLNVPYDAAMIFTRRPDLQAQVFQNAAVYLDQEVGPGSFVHLTPENSRRLRALASWFTLTAYGKDGYAAIVERTCRLARRLGGQIDASPHFRLLAPVRLNGICFTLNTQGDEPTLAGIQGYLRRVQEGGRLFLTPTLYKGTAAMRISITNWRTTEEDVAIAWQALEDACQAGMRDE